MPVDNLPKTLECVLKGLLDESQLLFWSIQGGNIYTQLSIRFAADDMNNSTFGSNCVKKIQKSRILWERKRTTTYWDTINGDSDSDAESKWVLIITQ